MPLESIDSWDSIKETNKWLMNCMSDDIEHCNGKWKLQTEKGRFEYTAIEIHCGKYHKRVNHPFIFSIQQKSTYLEKQLIN